MGIKRALKDLLWRALPPGLFHFVRYGWWCFSFYFPLLVASLFVRRTPEVRGFGGTLVAPRLVGQLGGVNVLAPTRTCRVMVKYGSDKGGGYHNYTTLYSVLFGGIRDRALRVFELGLGTNNPAGLSTMGIYGAPGASLRAWRELFPRAFVYGADIDRDILLQEDRIKTFYCDQLDSASIRELWSQPELRDGMDIIVEDGLHSFDANVSFLEGSIEHLRPGGFYVIEDIAWKWVDKWCQRLETVYSKQYPTFEFALVTLPNALNPRLNNLLVARRGADRAAYDSARLTSSVR